MYWSRIIIWLLLVIYSITGMGQQFFSIIDDPDNYFNQKIARFSNGDILIVDSSLEALRSGGGGKIYATRIDICGNTVWSSIYEHNNYSEFKDLAISSSGEIYIYGSEYQGLQESIFIIKLNGSGNVILAKLFYPESVDHFAYTIGVKENQVMLYGLLLDFNTKKQGFLVSLDDNLNYKWGKIFAPFESIGDAIITKNNEFICRSGQYHFKFDANGNLIWAKELMPNLGARTIQGPVEMNNGFLFESNQQGQSFLYQLDNEGNLRWKTAQFAATASGSSAHVLTNQNIAVAHLCADGTATLPSYTIFSPNGALLQQKMYQTELPLFTKTIYQSVDQQNALVTVAGNADPLGRNDIAKVNFLMQFSLDNNAGDCFELAEPLVTQVNTAQMNFIPLDVNISATNMRSDLMEGLKVSKNKDFFAPYCGGGIELVQLDTLLDCDNDWLVNLPNNTFFWEDGNKDNPRLLNTVGTYRAKSTDDCAQTQIYEYTLRKPACQCKVYLPTAFTPNGDQMNDELQLFTNCNLQSVQMTVYNRWGQQVFYANGENAAWDGTVQQKPVQEGVYVIAVQYAWLDNEGNTQQRSFSQEVTLYR